MGKKPIFSLRTDHIILGRSRTSGSANMKAFKGLVKNLISKNLAPGGLSGGLDKLLKIALV